MSRIFISHSSKDNFAAVAVRDWLAAEGWNEVFLDLDPERGIAAGERWERALHAAATRCEAVVFLVSANWLASGWCLKEYSLARGLNKKLFAAIIDPATKIDALPLEYRGTWQAVDLTGGQGMRIVAITLPSSHEEQHVAFSQAGLRRLRVGLEKAGLDPKFFAWPPEGEADRAPYRGLAPLDRVDAGIFFGRDAPIVEASDLLRGLRDAAAPRLLVLLGASGAGKSSFLRAGLLPRLARDDAHFLTLPPIRPERAALTGDNGLLGALEAALPRHTRAELRDAIAGGAPALRPLLAALVDAAFTSTLADDTSAKRPTLVIAVDQAEELFRAEGVEEGAALLALLGELSLADEPATIVLFAIRSDAYDALQHAPALEGLAQKTLPLQPMPRGAYAAVIEGPARRLAEAGGRLTIEPQLTQRLLEDVEKGGGSDALPLLAFTLEQLFRDHRQAGALKLEHYERSRGLAGAIEAAVERAYRRADTDGRIPRERAARETLLRRGLIPWLAGIDPDTRSSRRNIARRADIPAEAAPLIDLLVEERLLATDTMPVKDAGTGVETRVATIEPAHESLLRQWGLLQGWLEADFGWLATLEGVKRAARDWDANARSAEWLGHGGQRLAEAQGLDARPDIAGRLDAVDRGYLAECRAREEAQRAAETAQRAEREAAQARELRDAQAVAAANRRTARRTLWGLAAALVLAVAAGVFGYLALEQRRIADRRTVEAQEQKHIAEQSAADAKAQKRLADERAAEAREQKRLAEMRAVEAQRQKRIADERTTEAKAQKQIAEQRAAEAKAQQARAERAVASAVGAADTLIFGLTQKFRNAAGMPASLIKSILDQALKLQDTLIGAGEASPALRRSQSVALNEAVETLLQIGDVGGALKAAARSAAIMRKLLEEQPGNRLWRRDLSLSLGRIGDVQLQAGERAGALAAYEESLSIARERAKDKGDAQAQRDLSVSLNKIGNVRLQAGDRAGALAVYEESLSISRERAKDKGDAQAQRDLSVSLNYIGDVKLHAGDRAGALAAYAEELAIHRERATDKGDAQAQRDLSVSLDKIGDVKLQAGDRAGALAAYEESLSIRRERAKDKGDAQAQRDLSISLNKIGDVKLQTGDRAGALAACEESLSIARERAKDKGDAQAQRDLSVSLDRIGDVKLQAGDRAGALAAYEEELAIHRERAKDKGDVQAQRDLSVSLNKIGDMKLQAGDRAGALAAYEESLSIAREHAKDKGDAQAQLDLVVSLFKMSSAGSGAVARLTEAFAVLKELDASGRLPPANQGWVAIVEKALDEAKAGK